jgi:hypothetical protein
MSRTYFLAGALVIVVMLSWVLTLYFADRLPPTLPLNFGDKPYAIKGPRDTFLLFPITVSAIALAVLLLMPFRKSVPFPGRRRLLTLPKDLRDLFLERIYQILLVIAVFVSLLITYLQASIALYSTNIISEMRIWPVYAAGAVFIAYLAYNLLLIIRSIGSIGKDREQQGDDSAKAQ